MLIFLSGAMGSGKSTLAQALGCATGEEVVDLDALIEARAGRDIPSLFAERGETAFRELERETLLELLARRGRGVVALGGGTVTQERLRRQLLRRGLLITLEANLDETMQRVGDGAGRPLLAGGDAREKFGVLLAQRAAAYAECHARLDTSGRDPDDLAREVLRVAEQAPLVVPLGLRTYRVVVGRGVRAQLPDQVGGMCGNGALAVVSDDHVAPLWAGDLARALRAEGRTVIEVTLPHGEENKTIAAVECIWQAAFDARLDRHSAMLSVCGGVVGDLTGFAAATFLRGIAVGHLPTTLLAMVDSAIGGKTGFDTRAGKNLIGAFHQPSFVLCDVDVLSTLPQRERRAGLAEVVKSAFIEGEGAMAQIERDSAALSAGEPEATIRAIRMSATMKAGVVTEDEREGGRRAVLNLGHTLGHAIEAAQGYRGMRHGEAVALGMVAACRVAQNLGVGSRAEGERLERLLAVLGLPTDVGRYLDPRVFAYIGSDKKRRADRITFVVPAAPGDVRLMPIELTKLPALLGVSGS